MSSGHGEFTVCINLQHLWVACRRSVQDQSGQYSNMEREENKDPPTMQWWTVGVSGEDGNRSFKECGPL